MAKGVIQTRSQLAAAREAAEAEKPDDPGQDHLIIPSPEIFQAWIDGACRAVAERLAAGGARYGEQVLFGLGETGAVAQCYTKAARALWSFQQGHDETERDDTWLDLAGYAVLEIARKAYERGMSPGEIDGLFDRGKKRGS